MLSTCLQYDSLDSWHVLDEDRRKAATNRLEPWNAIGQTGNLVGVGKLRNMLTIACKLQNTYWVRIG